MSINGKFGGGSTNYELQAYRIVLTVVTPDGILGGADESDNPLPPVVISYPNFVPNSDKRTLMATISVGEDGSIHVE